MRVEQTMSQSRKWTTDALYEILPLLHLQPLTRIQGQQICHVLDWIGENLPQPC